MIIFWIIAAVMTLAALAFLLPTLMGKSNVAVGDIDQNTLNARIARERLAALEGEFEGGAMSEVDYQRARTEVENNLLDDVDIGPEADITGNSGATTHWSPVIVGIIVPIIAVFAYVQLGEVEAVDYVPPERTAQSNLNHLAEGSPDGVGSIEKMAETLAARLEENPEDPKGWSMLGRTYEVMQRFGDASFAYQTALSLKPNDPDIMVNLAESLAMSEGGRLQGQARELLDEALAVEPEHGKALWLKGMAHYQVEEFKDAVDRWMPVLASLPAGSPAIAELSNLVREAATKGGFEAPALATAAAPLVNTLPEIGSTPPATNTAKAPSDAAAPSIKVSVSLSPELAEKVNPNDSLFIFARATAGPKMPLAAIRLKASDLPITVLLNEAMAMIPSMTLSKFDQVLVGARLSKSGQAIASAGDLYGHVSPVEVKADQSVTLVINQIK